MLGVSANRSNSEIANYMAEGQIAEMRNDKDQTFPVTVSIIGGTLGQMERFGFYSVLQALAHLATVEKRESQLLNQDVIYFRKSSTNKTETGVL